MSKRPSVVVLGGGLSGVAAACELVERGFDDVTLIEAGDRLGGLAGSFVREGRFYPLGYHHILHRDARLLKVLDSIGAGDTIRWRRVHVNFFQDGRLHDLSSPAGFARFPMSMADKARFVRLMLRAFRKQDWSDWEGRTAADLVDTWAGPGVRHAIFEPLTRIRFELPCDQISGAWLGARLFHREGSARLGFIPDTNWTQVLCQGMARRAQELDVVVRLNSTVRALHRQGDAIVAAELAGGEQVRGDLFVNTLPTEVYARLMPSDATPGLKEIRYTALLSLVCAVRHALPPNLYWVSLTGKGHTACGIFQLNALNPSIGKPGQSCINYVTHLRGRERPLFTLGDDELLSAYREDFKKVFGADPEPEWVQVNRIPMYAPMMSPAFRNLPVRSASLKNVYFAGNYRTFPSILSTGTAMESGIETARVVATG